MAEQPLGIHSIERIKRALEKGDTAAIPEVIRVIQKLTSKVYSITNHGLTDLIEQHDEVKQKILTISNTMGYNPIGIIVKTIPHAIQIIGFERIRNLVISILLGDNKTQKLSIQEQEEATSFCLTTALLAKQLTKGYQNFDPQISFSATLLRNYGELLFATFMIDEYREAQEKLGTPTEDDYAYQVALGISPMEIGYRLLKSQNLPEEITDIIKKFSKETIQLEELTEIKDLLYIGKFSAKIVEFIIDENLAYEEFTIHIKRLQIAFSKILRITDEGFNEALLQVSQELEGYHNNSKIDNKKNHISKSLSARINKRVPEKREIAINPNEDSELSNQNSKPIDPLKTLEKGLQVLQAFKTEEKKDKNTLTDMMIDILYQSLELTDLIVFNKTEALHTFKINEGKGPIFRTLLGTRTNFNKRKSVFTLCLSRKEDINITNALDKKVINFIPDWMTMSPAIKSFILLPVIINEEVDAIFCCASTHDSAIQLTAKKLDYIKQIKRVYAEIKTQEISNR